MENSLRRYKPLVRALHNKYRQAIREKEAADIAKKASVVLRDEADAAHAILQAIAEQMQTQACGRIADVVTRCLAAVFDDPYEFRLTFVEKRGRTDAVMMFCRDGVEVSPLDASGGGVVDVAAFALRVAAIALSRPAVRRLLIMDEPFKFVSPAFRPRVADMLNALAEDLDFQFVMVTHMPELEIGDVIRLGE